MSDGELIDDDENKEIDYSEEECSDRLSAEEALSDSEEKYKTTKKSIKSSFRKKGIARKGRPMKKILQIEIYEDLNKSDNITYKKECTKSNLKK